MFWLVFMAIMPHGACSEGDVLERSWLALSIRLQRILRVIGPTSPTADINVSPLWSGASALSAARKL